MHYELVLYIVLDLTLANTVERVIKYVSRPLLGDYIASTLL